MLAVNGEPRTPARARTSVTGSFGAASRPTMTTRGGLPSWRAGGAAPASTAVGITTVSRARHVRAATPAERSRSETQTVVVVSGAISRSAQRYSADTGPEYALNAHPCAVKIRTGTPSAAAAVRPSRPALELLACRMSGRSRRISAASSNSPSRSWAGCRFRRMWRRGT